MSSRIASQQKILNHRGDTTKSAPIGATSWEICDFKNSSKYIIPMEKPFKNMALKLTTEQIGG